MCSVTPVPRGSLIASSDSSNCAVTMRPCIYPPPSIPLNERKLTAKSRTLPGQNAPWHAAGDRLNRVVTAIAPIYGPLGAPLDPFESLALKMPFKSADLLHYCNYLWQNLTCDLVADPSRGSCKVRRVLVSLFFQACVRQVRFHPILIA
jgi:hypothetical protein